MIKEKHFFYYSLNLNLISFPHTQFIDSSPSATGGVMVS